MGRGLLRHALGRLAGVVLVVLAVPSLSWVLAGPYPLRSTVGRQLRALPDYLLDTFWRWDWGVTGPGGQFSVLHLVGEGLPVDVALVVGGLLVGTALGVATGLRAGSHPGGLADRAVSAATAVGLSAPPAFVAGAVVGTFSVKAGLVPVGVVSDYQSYVAPWQDPLGWLHALWAPWLVCALPLAAVLARLTRAAIADGSDADHLRTARAKGLSESAVLVRHALPSAAPVVLAALAVNVPLLVTNAVLVEVPFGLPGVLALADLRGNDLPDFSVLQAVTIELATLTAVGMALCDVLHAWADPRVRAGGSDG